MKRVLVVLLIVLVGFVVLRSCVQQKAEKALLEENTLLIQRQIANVGKLIVTEGHFAEVYTYKDSQELFGPLVTADKKALVVVNAEVTVAYDLRQVDFEVDTDQQTLRFSKLPDPDIKIHPDFEYYDVTADFLNPFEAADYNRIKKTVRASLLKKVEASSLRKNAENRLLSELQQFFILTRSMGWTLEYQNKSLDTMEELQLAD